MNINSPTRDAAQGWTTFCGTFKSECIAVRTVPNPRAGEGGQPSMLIELGHAEGEGGTFTVPGHEVDQFVRGYTMGNVPQDVLDAVAEDVALGQPS